MDRYFVIDTNVLLESPEIINDYNVVITSMVLRELEKHKISHNGDLAYKARRATRIIDDNSEKIKLDLKDYTDITFDTYADKNYVDNQIIQMCIENSYGIITNDLLLKLKAKSYEIEVVKIEEKNNDDYKGVYELFISDSKEDQELLANLYEIPERNQLKLVQNQYLYIWNKNKPNYNNDREHNGYELIDNLKFDGQKLVKLKYKTITNKFDGHKKIKPINKKQEMLFDLLQNNDITIKSVFGKYGVGKDFIMISHALDLMDQGKIDKIIWARNNVELKDVPSLGTLPGDKVDKLIEFAMPLVDHLGGIEGLKMFLLQGKIEIQHLGSLRGRDIKKSIIYVTEAQNNTDSHIELLIGRVGEGSQLWINGDLKQTDKEVYERNSGIRALYKLKGHYLYGQAELDKTERSETAKLAELISK